MGKKKTKKSARKVGRPPGLTGKSLGSPMVRKILQRITQTILNECSHSSRAEVAKLLGLNVSHINNLRQGNLPGIRLILKLFRDGKISPKSLILDNKIKKLESEVSTDSAHHDLVSMRVRELARKEDAAELAERSGLPVTTIYQTRVANRRSGLRTILGFIDAGASPDYIFLGLETQDE